MQSEKIKRFRPNIKFGLTKEQVEERINDNLTNKEIDTSTKAIKEILKENIITLFNIINIVLAIAVISVKSFKNLTFMIVIICNTAISIIQEIRSKRTLDQLKVLSKSKVKVLRNGEFIFLDTHELVLDDIFFLETGSEVVVDSYIKTGQVEVNESFITGEVEPVIKKEGDLLLSGSFIISGTCTCQVEHIGLDNYTEKLAYETKKMKPISSEIMRSLQKIVSTISFLIVPVGILLFSRQYYLSNNTIDKAIVNTVAALIGMIPEGLVLLTSTVLAISVIRLSKEKVLVQDLYCIESLARVDTLCIDKTGTITEGVMKVEKEIQLKDIDICPIIKSMNFYLKENNPTARALQDFYGEQDCMEILEVIPFSSERKYSGIITNDKTYVVGAYEFLFSKNDKSLEKTLKKYSNDYRVLVVTEAKNKKLQDIRALGIILIQDKIRKDAKEILEFFKSQDVKLKIISGDNKDTVLGIARRVGLKEELRGIDATSLKTDEDILENIEKYDVFGRVTPEQKKKMVTALQYLGHTVAMTGDGVNDILALKKADCSIAMASGSDATKNVSQIVLLDSNFSAMKEIVKEGRRTINNIERSASLFLVKTIYATLLAIIFIFIEMPYPFIPIQLTLTSVVTIGIPSFILALEPNFSRVKDRFLPHVLKIAIPPAITIVLNILVVFIASTIIGLPYEKTSTLSVIVTGYTSFVLLYKVCSPMNLLRKLLYIVMLSIYIIGAIFFKELFSFANLDLIMILIIIICIILSNNLYKLIEDTVKKFLN